MVNGRRDVKPLVGAPIGVDNEASEGFTSSAGLRPGSMLQYGSQSAQKVVKGVAGFFG